MGKRSTSRQQRRMCPDHRRKRPKQGHPLEPRPPARLTRSGLPILQDEDLAHLFGDKSVQESFAELVEESLATTGSHQALREKQLSRQPRRSAADRFRESIAPQEELDLHGLTGPEAAVRIDNFIRTARGKGLKALRIITGKGLHSEGPAVLPEVAEHKFRELKEHGLLIAYRWEKKKREKSGSVIIYLI